MYSAFSLSSTHAARSTRGLSYVAVVFDQGRASGVSDFHGFWNSIYVLFIQRKAPIHKDDGALKSWWWENWFMQLQSNSERMNTDIRLWPNKHWGLGVLGGFKNWTQPDFLLLRNFDSNFRSRYERWRIRILPVCISKSNFPQLNLIWAGVIVTSQSGLRTACVLCFCSCGVALCCQFIC